MDKGIEATTRIANTQTIYPNNSTQIPRETIETRISAEEMFSDTSLEVSEKNRATDDRRTGVEAASDIIQLAKDEGPSHALHDLGEGKVFPEQDKIERQDSDTSVRKYNSTKPDSNNEDQEVQHTKREQKFDLKIYHAIWKNIYEKQTKNGGELDIDTINKQAEAEYHEYQEYKAAKQERVDAVKPDDSQEEFFKNQNELTPEEKIVKLQEHVQDLSQTQHEMKEELAKTRDDYDTLRQSVITLAEAFTAYLELEKKKKKDGDEISFLEILIKLVNKLLTEMFTLDEYTGKPPKKDAEQPTFKILHVDEERPQTNVVSMDEYKKKKGASKPEPQEKIKEAA